MNTKALPFDNSVVDLFAQSMKDKLAISAAKGRSGWQTCPPDDLRRMLREHLEKGDPVDVANFAMFLWWLGQSTAPQPPAPAVECDCEGLVAALKNLLGYAENWPNSFAAHDCWKYDAARARAAIAAHEAKKR
jgi:hypothetical protein